MTKYDSDPESFRQINIMCINLEYKKHVSLVCMFI